MRFNIFLLIENGSTYFKIPISKDVEFPEQEWGNKGATKGQKRKYKGSFVSSRIIKQALKKFKRWL